MELHVFYSALHLSPAWISSIHRSKDLEMVQLAFEAVLLDRLGRAALDSDKCIKYAATLIMLVQRAISSATDGVPGEELASPAIKFDFAGCAVFMARILLFFFSS